MMLLKLLFFTFVHIISVQIILDFEELNLKVYEL